MSLGGPDPDDDAPSWAPFGSYADEDLPPLDDEPAAAPVAKTPPASSAFYRWPAAEPTTTPAEPEPPAPPVEPEKAPVAEPAPWTPPAEVAAPAPAVPAPVPVAPPARSTAPPPDPATRRSDPDGDWPPPRPAATPADDAKRARRLATISIYAAVLSFILFGPLAGIVAIVCGVKARIQTDAPQVRTMAMTGIVIGTVGIAFTLFGGVGLLWNALLR